MKWLLQLLRLRRIRRTRRHTDKLEKDAWCENLSREFCKNRQASVLYAATARKTRKVGASPPRRYHGPESI
jgi:hypothetical protein